MTFWQDPSYPTTGDIVGLVFICFFGSLFLLMVLGCIIVRCSCRCTNNVLWPSSRAQQALVEQVQRKRLRVAAHRGGSISNAENSLGAFQYCIKNGVGLLEMDLCESKDGIPVVAHDHDLERVIDPAWRRAHPECITVSDCDARDPNLLPPYAEKIRLHFSSPTTGTYDKHKTSIAAVAKEQRRQQQQQNRGDAIMKDHHDEEEGEEDSETAKTLHRLCTLEEVLNIVPRNVAIHVDIKQPSKTLVKSTLDLIASHPRAAPTVILGAGGTQNFVDLHRRLGRSRGFRLSSCCNNHKNNNNNKQNEEVENFGNDYCDQHMCMGCCVCCCCCFSPIQETDNSICCCCGCCCEKNEEERKESNGSNSGIGKEPSAITTLLTSDPNRRPLIFAGMLQVVLVYVFHILGVLPYIPLDFDVFSIPAPTSTMKEMLTRFLPCGASYLVWLLESPALWDYLRSRGIVVFGWVLNSERDFEEATQWPLDGIMTDDVPALNQFFLEKKPDAFMV